MDRRNFLKYGAVSVASVGLSVSSESAFAQTVRQPNDSGAPALSLAITDVATEMVDGTWLNMIGSILFMISALASYVLPSTGELINSGLSIIGTLLGALCFLLGAILMFPAWRQALQTTAPALPEDPQHRVTT